MGQLDAALSYIRAHHDEFLEGYKELLEIPSISTLPEHKPDVLKCAEWLERELTRLGLERVRIIPTAGHPVVYGEWLNAPGKPVALVYGHYDVQPADPLDEWTDAPFEPVVRGEHIYARGASDMKGQLFANLKALESLFQSGGPPLNLKLMLEGEEEVGSAHLEAFIEEHRNMLACDAVLNCDGGIYAPDRPSITYALRGLAYFELTVRGPAKDLHSGLFGGAVYNPAQALCELIAGMHDTNGRVTLPGFYDKVRELSSGERQVLAELPLSDADLAALSGAPSPHGEQGYTHVERIGARPTLEVNGLLSGFTGEGSKTVLPAKAMAKISMRLVPDQDPADIEAQLRAYLDANIPPAVTYELKGLAHGAGAVMNREAPPVQAAAQALEATFGRRPFFRREGGSVPVVSLLQHKLGVDSVMLGFALPGDGIHGPNEKQHLPTFFRGIETYARFFVHLAG